MTSDLLGVADEVSTIFTSYTPYDNLSFSADSLYSLLSLGENPTAIRYKCALDFGPVVLVLVNSGTGLKHVLVGAVRLVSRCIGSDNFSRALVWQIRAKSSSLLLKVLSASQTVTQCFFYCLGYPITLFLCLLSVVIQVGTVLGIS